MYTPPSPSCAPGIVCCIRVFFYTIVSSYLITSFLYKHKLDNLDLRTLYIHVVHNPYLEDVNVNTLKCSGKITYFTQKLYNDIMLKLYLIFRGKYSTFKLCTRTQFYSHL